MPDGERVRVVCGEVDKIIDDAQILRLVLSIGEE